MNLITPDFGLFFWMALAFGILVVVLGRVAWKPILNGLKSRETRIAEALNQAERAQSEIAELKREQEAMREEMRRERDALLAEARQQRDRIVSEAQAKAQAEAERLMRETRATLAQQLEGERKEMKREAVALVMMATERILRQHFEDQQAHRDHVQRLIAEMEEQEG